MTPRFISAILLLLVMHSLAGAQTVDSASPVPASDTRDPSQACLELCGKRPCEWPEFRGFSANSDRLGFSVLKCPAPGALDKPRRFFHVRTIEGRLGRQGLKNAPVRGVQFYRYFKQNGFVVNSIAPTDVQPMLWSASLPSGQSLTIELKTERTMVVEVSAWNEGKLLFRSKVPLYDIYFGMSAEAFMAPDGKRMFLVLHLDAQYKWDAWTAAFSLSP